MATSDRVRKQPAKKSTKKPATAKKSDGKRASSKGRKPAGYGTGERLGEFAGSVFRREVLGVILVIVGLFFTAAFISGRGAVLGDLGLFAAGWTFGRIGIFLAPLAVIVGVLMLLDRLYLRAAAGGGLLVLAITASLAAALPEDSRLDAARYSEAGGIVGSGAYAAVYAVGGVVGAMLALFVLYVAGVFLLTGTTPERALNLGKSGSERTSSAWRDARGRAKERRVERLKVREEAAQGSAVPRRRSKRASTREETKIQPHVQDLYGELEEPVVRSSAEPAPPAGSSPEDTPAPEPFEIVLPEKKASSDFEAQGEVDATSEEYTLPPLSLLGLGHGDPEHDAEGTSQRLTQALADLGVEAHVLRAVVGPRVTRYELRLGSGVKVGKVRNLQQDIAYALAATEVRILAPIPGKSAVGVEVPNTRAATVTLGDVFAEYPEANDWALPVGLGKDISGRAVFFDLSEMPHLLVAGTTGSGKSVMLNGLLTSLLLTTDPRHVKLVLIDPKRVELSQFGRIPHLITPVVTDVKKAANALVWAVAEMERRYEVLEKAGVRSLEGYNARNEDQPIPFVVVVIDELADLMMTSGAKVEDAIIRLAQKARAVGIHLVVATQRPSVDVITGMIKANIPSRIAFAVSSQVDSRVILDNPGAEALLGMGDMLYKPVSAMRSSRVQGAFISESEVDKVVSASEAAAKGRVEAVHVEEVTTPKKDPKESEEPDDDLLPDAASFIISTQQASVSAVQRRFRVGYSRAGRIIDALERKGIVGPYEGSKSRSVVGSELDLGRLFGDEEEDRPVDSLEAESGGETSENS